MLFVGQTGKIQAKVEPGGFVLAVSDHDWLFLDKQVPVLRYLITTDESIAKYTGIRHAGEAAGN